MICPSVTPTPVSTQQPQGSHSSDGRRSQPGVVAPASCAPPVTEVTALLSLLVSLRGSSGGSSRAFVDPALRLTCFTSPDALLQPQPQPQPRACCGPPPSLGATACVSLDATACVSGPGPDLDHGHGVEPPGHKALQPHDPKARPRPREPLTPATPTNRHPPLALATRGSDPSPSAASPQHGTPAPALVEAASPPPDGILPPDWFPFQDLYGQHVDPFGPAWLVLQPILPSTLQPPRTPGGAHDEAGWPELGPGGHSSAAQRQAHESWLGASPFSGAGAPQPATAGAGWALQPATRWQRGLPLGEGGEAEAVAVVRLAAGRKREGGWASGGGAGASKGRDPAHPATACADAPSTGSSWMPWSEHESEVAALALLALQGVRAAFILVHSGLVR